MAKHQAILWPDHNIGKRESRRIRDAHNALYNDYHKLLEALRGLCNQCDGIGHDCTPEKAIIEQVTT